MGLSLSISDHISIRVARIPHVLNFTMFRQYGDRGGKHNRRGNVAPMAPMKGSKQQTPTARHSIITIYLLADLWEINLSTIILSIYNRIT